MCSDPKKVWYPQRSVCRVTMEQAAARRQYEALHEARPYHDGSWTHFSAEASSATPYHVLDGVDIYVAEEDLNPNDEFLKPQNPFDRLRSDE